MISPTSSTVHHSTAAPWALQTLCSHPHMTLQTLYCHTLDSTGTVLPTPMTVQTLYCHMSAARKGDSKRPAWPGNSTSTPFLDQLWHSCLMNFSISLTAQVLHNRLSAASMAIGTRGSLPGASAQPWP